MSTDPRQLRAPDVAVGPVPDGDGWLKQAPLLALEYTARGQDQGEIEAKIAELLEAGTRYIWVVHLTGLPRVDVHTPGQAVKTVDLEGVLDAPGVLRNPVPVKALFDRRTAHQVVLRNLLQREGYEDLDAVRIEGFDEGHSEGLEEGRIDGEAAMLHRLLEAKFGPLPRPVLERLALADEEQLLRWGERLLSAETLEAVVE